MAQRLLCLTCSMLINAIGEPTKPNNTHDYEIISYPKQLQFKSRDWKITGSMRYNLFTLYTQVEVIVKPEKNNFSCSPRKKRFESREHCSLKAAIALDFTQWITVEINLHRNVATNVIISPAARSIERRVFAEPRLDLMLTEQLTSRIHAYPLRPRYAWLVINVTFKIT